MTYDNFFTTFNNKYVEAEDTSALNQCVDLIFKWCDALNIPRDTIRHPSAFQIWENPTDSLVKYFWVIPSTPTNVPLKGDIVVWKSSYNGGAGHVGIANGRADVNSLDVFEQNDPLKTSAHIKTYSYTGIYGWLRRITTVDTTALQQQITNLNTQVTALQGKINAAKAALV
jgi:hypothetical protein